MTAITGLYLATNALLNAQTQETAWYFECSKVLGIDLKYLQKDGWDGLFWRGGWGTLERLEEKRDGKSGIAWHRPDCDKSIAMFEESESVLLCKFALLANLSQALLKAGELSYCTIGWPLNWRRAKVLLNGEEVNYVREADALLGTITVAVRKAGSFVRDGDEIATRTVKGSVRIELAKENAGFF